MSINDRRVIDGIEYVELQGGVLLPSSYLRERVRVRRPADVLPLLAEERIAVQERLVVFTLDGANQVIRKHVTTVGLANQCQIHPREVFRVAILDAACSVLIAHNHPSGSVEPSESDLAATKRLTETSKTIGIPVLDHLIVAAERHTSIRESHPHCF